jgi:hypothetical protein
MPSKSPRRKSIKKSPKKRNSPIRKKTPKRGKNTPIRKSPRKKNYILPKLRPKSPAYRKQLQRQKINAMVRRPSYIDSKVEIYTGPPPKGKSGAMIHFQQNNPHKPSIAPVLVRRSDPKWWIMGSELDALLEKRKVKRK